MWPTAASNDPAPPQNAKNSHDPGPSKTMEEERSGLTPQPDEPVGPDRVDDEVARAARQLGQLLRAALSQERGRVPSGVHQLLR